MLFSTRRRGACSGASILAGVAIALASGPGRAVAQQTSAPIAPSTELRIKDPAEASDYAAAMIMTDPAQQAAALEAFVARYPSSRVKSEALESALAAWLVARDLDKVEALSSRVLAAEPRNARARAMRVFAERARAGAAAAPQAKGLAEQAGADAEKGLADLGRWNARAGASEADAAAVRSEMLAEFNGALGYRLLVRKDYAAARPFYLAAIKADPTNLDDVYQLSICLLQSTPIEPAGFWWAARAESLAADDPAARATIEGQIKPLYIRYHGGDEGWDGLVTQAASALSPPADFTVSPAASASAVAVQAAHDAPVSALSLSDWAFIAALQARGVRLKFPARVTGVDANHLDAAIGDASPPTARADLHVKLTAPLDPAPAVGAMITVTGVLTGYDAAPFAFIMEQADIAAP